MSQKYSPNRKKSKNKSKPFLKKSNDQSAVSSVCLLYGMHTVEAALKNPDRTIHRILVTHNAAARINELVNVHKTPVTVVDIKELDRMLGTDVVHQGVLIEAEPLPVADIRDLALCTPVLVLDQITDPHNVGAITRSAAAFGAGAIIMTTRNSPPLSGVMAKAASGGLEHVPVCLVSNLSRALEQLAEAGYWRIGLDSEGEDCLENIRHDGPVALVLGAEGKGLRRLTRENCDQIARISTASDLASLNVSNAAAVALHTLYTSSTGGHSPRT